MALLGSRSLKRVLVFKSITLFFCFLNLVCYMSLNAQETRLPIGINLQKIKKHLFPAFNDVMKQSELQTFNEDHSGDWNSKLISQLVVDENGYPLEIPQNVQNELPQKLRISLNNFVSPGQYVVLYDGEGSLRFRVTHSFVDGQDRIYLDGSGVNKSIEIDYSKTGNHIRNIRILPIEEDGQIVEQTFNSLFLEGLKPFHCIRFSTWMEHYFQEQFTWEMRPTPTSITQTTKLGVAIEYIVELCNELKCDCWCTIPTKADDSFIQNYAIYVKENLDPTLKVYLEYSNEPWNPVFLIYHYIVDNAPGAIDSYISQDLANIDEDSKNLGSKYGYMAQRVFKTWSEVFSGDSKERLVRAAGTHTANPWQTAQICKFLFKVDEKGQPITSSNYNTSLGLGCDAIAGTGYFSPSREEIKYWSTLPEEELTPQEVIDATKNEMYNKIFIDLEQTVENVNTWGCDFIVYEGGQHIVTYKNKKWPTTQALWDAQITPEMYELYNLEFEKQVSEKINCKLFCAYEYVNIRESIFGSWGHLESLNQLLDLSKIRIIAPKYAALLDNNIPRESR